MGSDTSRFIILMVFSSLLSSIVCGGSSGSYDTKALDALFRYYANQTLNEHRRTGILHRVSLPSNFSGMKVSVDRLRSGSLWGRGVDSKYVKIPPSVRTLPCVKRLAIVYDNMGNWSSEYYHVPGKPISIRFPFVETKEKNVTRLKCVVFGKNGSFVLKNMTKRDVCVTEKAGHFCVVTRTKSSKPEKEEGSEGLEMVGDRVGLGGSEDVEMVEREEDQRHGRNPIHQWRWIRLGQGKS
ncbi:uncharacterized protein LOC120131138 [Hibiscus syriacus]|uniref:uncharacterized protein LOC120131138 n=1 Tax=Hibiscus syriacus TaxID=106335 RepID=UPI00192313C6|nr:uncharacterized protein LOC120131138 [Hibiscus syriacus]